MYESPWLSIQWRCFQTCFIFQYSFTLDWYTQPGHKKVLWTSTSTLTLLQIQGKEKQGFFSRVFEKRYMKPPPTIERENGTSIQAAYYQPTTVFATDDLQGWTAKPGYFPRGISKVPNCKGCCWKTWFPGTRCYTNLGYHGFWWRKEMDKMESLAEQMRGKHTHWQWMLSF